MILHAMSIAVGWITYAADSDRLRVRIGDQKGK